MVQQGKQHIHWNDLEWEQFATLLAHDHPRMGLETSTDLGPLTCRMLNLSSARMPRPRAFVNLDAPRAKLLEAYARLRAREAADTAPVAEQAAVQAAPPVAQALPHEDIRIFWDNQEWEDVAEVLHEDNPSANFMHSRDLAALSLAQLNAASAQMGRPRRFYSIVKARPKLLAAYARLRARPPASVAAAAVQPAPVPVSPAPVAPPAAPVQEEGGKVFWDEREWESFAELLDQANPGARFIDSPDLAELTLPQINAVASAMARPRRLTNPERLRPKLLAIYAHLRAKRPMPEPDAAPEVKPEPKRTLSPDARVHRAPPPAEPPSPLKLDEHQRPLPAARVASVEPAPPAPAPAIAWDRSEWLAIATEIDREYPGSNYPGRPHLAGLTSEDVAFAQRVLPFERQIRHVRVASFSSLLPGLQGGFADLRQQRARQAQAEQGAREALARASATRPASEPAPAAAVVPDAAAVAPAVASAPAAAPLPVAMPADAGALVQQLGQLLGPLFSHGLDLLAARLRPMIAELIDQALLAPAPTAPPAAPPEASAPVAPAPALPAATVKEADKAPRLRIGIVGTHNPTYPSELARDFPEIEFKWVASTREAATLRNCNPVICVTKFCSHMLRDSVLKLIPRENFMPIHGGLSDMRRVIGSLVKSTARLEHSRYPAPVN